MVKNSSIKLRRQNDFFDINNWNNFRLKLSDIIIKKKEFNKNLIMFLKHMLVLVMMVFIVSAFTPMTYKAAERIGASAASNPLGATSVSGFASRAAVAAARNAPYYALTSTLASVAFPVTVAYTGYSVISYFFD